MKKFFAALLAPLFVFVVSGCGGSAENEKIPDGPGRLRVTRVELGADWPLTVDEAYVGCDKGLSLWVARGATTKERWALNGSALQDGLPDLDTSNFWKADPKIAKSKNQH